MAFREVAFGVTNERRTGEIVIRLKIKPINDSSQVNCQHSIKYTKPTAKGSVVEDATTSTLLHVGKGGRMSLYPETQLDLLNLVRNGEASITQD